MVSISTFGTKWVVLRKLAFGVTLLVLAHVLQQRADHWEELCNSNLWRTWNEIMHSHSVLHISKGDMWEILFSCICMFHRSLFQRLKRINICTERINLCFFCVLLKENQWAPFCSRASFLLPDVEMTGVGELLVRSDRNFTCYFLLPFSGLISAFVLYLYKEHVCIIIYTPPSVHANAACMDETDRDK